MCVYIYIYTHMYIYIYIYINTHTRASADVADPRHQLGSPLALGLVRLVKCQEIKIPI